MFINNITIMQKILPKSLHSSRTNKKVKQGHRMQTHKVEFQVLKKNNSSTYTKENFDMNLRTYVQDLYAKTMKC